MGWAQARHYALEAGDGLPGAFRVAISADRAGRWHFEARWQGRSLAGLWIEDREGRTLARSVGASPQKIELVVSAEQLSMESRFLLRFSPMTARGALKGQLEIRPPADETAKPPPPLPRPVEISWPMSCLPAAGEAPEAQGRGYPEWHLLARLADFRAEAKGEEEAWAQRWIKLLEEATRLDIASAHCREALDLLWKRLPLDPPPSEEAGRSFRAVLAAIEDLVRREEHAHDSAPFAARRQQVAEALDCLIEAS